MACPEDIVNLMHEYLNETITSEDEARLRNYLGQSQECQTYFHELKKTVALVQSSSHVRAPSDFTMKVMQKLPKEKRTIGMKRWIKSHPFVTAASLFILLMAGSLFSLWTEDQQFSVSKQQNLVVENHTVIVPKGEVIRGDVVVKNGNLKIEGEVQGNVTVINGEKYLAGAGSVTGNIEEVNEMFDWLWYHIKNTFLDTFSFEKNGNSNS